LGFRSAQYRLLVIDDLRCDRVAREQPYGSFMLEPSLVSMGSGCRQDRLRLGNRSFKWLCVELDQDIAYGDLGAVPHQHPSDLSGYARAELNAISSFEAARNVPSRSKMLLDRAGDPDRRRRRLLHAGLRTATHRGENQGHRCD